MSRHAFSDLAMAAYCPRKLYYARRDGDRAPPPDVEARRRLATRYAELLAASDDELAAEPVAVDPATFRESLRSAKDRLDGTVWAQLTDPPVTDVHLVGRECHGVAHKVFDRPAPAPSIVSAGEPPEYGVWRPDAVRAVAAAKALAWERRTSVDVAYLEYPAYGVVRRVELTTRRKAAYRAAVRAVESIDGPPARTRNRAKCRSCEYEDRCGVPSRSLRALLRR